MLGPAEVDGLRVEVMQAGPRRKFGADVVAGLLECLDKANHDLAIERARSRDKGRLLAEIELRRGPHRPRGW